jgi:hypothetical protein
VPGIEFESAGGNRGMHGSFSPIDVHNTLIAYGPSFKSGAVVTTPTGNVDVAPTVAHVLGQSMPAADGRVLIEALLRSGDAATPTVTTSVIGSATPAIALSFKLPTDPSGAVIDGSLGTGTYSVDLTVKDLTVGGKTYRYFDQATAVRQ